MTNVPLGRKIVPGLQKPSLISSYEGTMEKILFSFPNWAIKNPIYANAYQTVIHALRKGTKFVVVHHSAARQVIEVWFSDAGHPSENINFIPLPDFVSLTDWAEDAYVALTDSADGTTYLMEPWEFKRAGDALIADAVEEYTEIKACQAPLIYQGGNCLVGKNFWLLGKDYFADSITLLAGERPPIEIPEGATAATFDGIVNKLFSNYIDRERKLIVIGTKKPLPIRSLVGTRVEDEYFLDIIGGTGVYQPIFHIDMFITLVGENTAGEFEILVGDPSMADQLLEEKSPYAMPEIYDSLSKNLESAGFKVKRNPLIHRSTIRKDAFLLSKLKEIASQQKSKALLDAVGELTAVGGTDNTVVRIRDWHHFTWNNCLVENSTTHGKHVYLPTYGYGLNSDLGKIDLQMKKLWEGLGFTVHLLGDFGKFVERQGVVHCIKKYLARGN